MRESDAKLLSDVEAQANGKTIGIRLPPTPDQMTRLLALVREQDAALRLAETALAEFGACPDPECREPNCARALGTVRRAIGKEA